MRLSPFLSLLSGWYKQGFSHKRRFYTSFFVLVPLFYGRFIFVPARFGDGFEYLGMVISIATHYSPSSVSRMLRKGVD